MGAISRAGRRPGKPRAVGPSRRGLRPAAAPLGSGRAGSANSRETPRTMETLFASWDWGALLKILGVNLVLSGDNAVLIALAAAGLPSDQRPKAIMFGMVLAVVLRIVLSIFAVYLLAIPGLLLVGGLLLLWIAYSFYKELRK